MKIKLIYPAQQFMAGEVPRPDGSLGLLYIAGALRREGFDVSLMDLCVGEAGDRLADSFFRRTLLDDTHLRIGLPVEVLQSRVQGCDVVAVTSIFTSNTPLALEVAAAVKQMDPSILTVAGGGNARALHRLFLDGGFDVVVCGEGEAVMVEVCRNHAARRGLEGVHGLAFKNRNGMVVRTPEAPVEPDLDRLPLPAWDLLPRTRYWEIGDPPGGSFDAASDVRYLTMQTSRGCPFRCSYCHISREGEGAKLRLKSDERVLREFAVLRDLGANHVFFQDDSLFADRERIVRLLPKIRGYGMCLADTNGVNVRHFFLGGGSRLALDEELLDVIHDCGMSDMAIAFESGSRRILNRYASRKWNPEKHNPVALVRGAAQRGLRTIGFFTIGYPDETLDELTETFLLAKRLVDEGLGSAAFYVVTPYPGTALYDFAIENGFLPPDLDFANMKFQIPTMVNTTVSPEILRYTRRLAYQLIHPAHLVAAKDAKTAAARARQ